VQSTSLAGRIILIVEDEPLIAVDIVTAFEGAGAATLSTRSLATAVRLVEHRGLSAAVLDFGLSDGHADTLCGRLNDRGIPFILHSGYTHASDACRGGIVIPKPADTATLVATLGRLLSAN
jgi:DNA-binding response OmpR family regulator